MDDIETAWAEAEGQDLRSRRLLFVSPLPRQLNMLAA
jgi:hypothetical protein